MHLLGSGAIQLYERQSWAETYNRWCCSSSHAFSTWRDVWFLWRRTSLKAPAHAQRITIQVQLFLQRYPCCSSMLIAPIFSQVNLLWTFHYIEPVFAYAPKCHRRHNITLVVCKDVGYFYIDVNDGRADNVGTSTSPHSTIDRHGRCGHAIVVHGSCSQWRCRGCCTDATMHMCPRSAHQPWDGYSVSGWGYTTRRGEKNRWIHKQLVTT